MKRILIAGKDSYIGTSVERYLCTFSEQYQVDTLDMKAGVESQSFAGYDTVYHVAGIAHSDIQPSAVSRIVEKASRAAAEKNHSREKELERLYYSVNTNLAIECAIKAKTAGVRQFIFMSSIIVYGESAPIGEKKVIKSDTPLCPANFYGDSKKRAEEGLALLRSEDFKVVILRPPMIYGKGAKGNYPALSRSAQLLPFFPLVENQRSMLYITNLCEFVRLMIENEEDGVFFPQNKTYMNTSRMVRAIGKVHGKRVVLVKGFEPLLRIAGKITSVVNKVFGSLVIDMSLSAYKDDYQLIGTMRSIRETESQLF